MFGAIKKLAGSVSGVAGGAIAGGLANPTNPWMGAIGGGLLGLGEQYGAMQQNEMQIASALEQMEFQREMLAKQRQFQRKSVRRQKIFQRNMSNTAVRRQIRDMRKGGLNPILAGKYGGASTPSSAAAMGGTGAGAQANIVNEMSPAISSAMQLQTNVHQNEVLRLDADLRFEQWLTQTHEADIRAVASDYAAFLKDLDERTAKAHLDIMIENLKIARRQGEVADTTFGKWMRYLGEFTGAIGNIFRGSATFSPR